MPGEKARSTLQHPGGGIAVSGDWSCAWGCPRGPAPPTPKASSSLGLCCSPARSFGIQGSPLLMDCQKVFLEVFWFLAMSGPGIVSKACLFWGRCFRPCLCSRLGPSAGLEGQSVPLTSNHCSYLPLLPKEESQNLPGIGGA